MPGVSSETRDLTEVSHQLENWLRTKRQNNDLKVSGLEGNAATGFSNQTLFFELTDTSGTAEQLVLRLPPAGDGLFPEYDMRRQWQTHSRLHSLGIPTADPSTLEEDLEWLGAPFIVMPRLHGLTPNDITYARKGWLQESSPEIQQKTLTSFIDLLCDLHTINPLAFNELLARAQGTGLKAELNWWRDYLDWASDGTPPTVMLAAYDWLNDNFPTQGSPDVVCWNDARFANVIYNSEGTIVAALDWEQATICPAELDISFWLATRRQACGAVGIHQDPELPGFLPRPEVIARIETRLGRELEHLDWHEVFSMTRMGTNIVGTQRALRRAGLNDHFLLQAPLLPEWTLAATGQHP